MNTEQKKQILKQFKLNEKNAINELYELYSRRLYNFTYSYLKTEDDTLDVIQNVFISLWDNREKLSIDTNLDSYIFTIAKNAIITLFRKKASEKSYLEHLRKTAIIYENNTEDDYDYELLSNQIQQIISELPEQRRRIFKLSKEEGLSNKEIALRLNISVKTVEDHKSKAKKFIKEKLSQSGFVALIFVELFI